MNLRILLSTILLYIAVLTTQAQISVPRIMEMKSQAEQCYNDKDYSKARSLFSRAFGEFAAHDKFELSVECGLKAAEIATQESAWREAIDQYGEVNQLLRLATKKMDKPLYSGYYNLAEGRFLLYLKLKNEAQANTQIDKMKEYAKQLKNDSINQNIEFMQAAYDYSFGKTQAGDATLQKLIDTFSSQQQYDNIIASFKNLIKLSLQTNNATLTAHLYDNYMVWSDSISALKSQDEHSLLQQKYTETLDMLSDKDDKLSYRMFLIVGTCILLSIIVVLFIILAINQIRLKANNNSFRKKIHMANENSELKTQFIHNISTQIRPSLDVIAAAEERLPETAKADKRVIAGEIAALKSFIEHIEELSALDTTLDVGYETELINAKSFCDNLVNEITPQLKPGVTITSDCPKMQIKANKEQLKHILMHLLNNAAIYTEEGNIRFDFKKRSAHTYQFVVSDVGTGIPEALHENLFKPFKQVEDLTKGDGLGLPICSLIATKMNGSIKLDTSYRKGCRFIVELHA